MKNESNQSFLQVIVTSFPFQSLWTFFHHKLPSISHNIISVLFQIILSIMQERNPKSIIIYYQCTFRTRYRTLSVWSEVRYRTGQCVGLVGTYRTNQVIVVYVVQVVHYCIVVQIILYLACCIIMPHPSARGII